MLLLIVLIQQVVLQHNQNPPGPIGIVGHGYEHMRGRVNRQLFFSNDSIHTEVHFIVDDSFLDTSCIYKSLLILSFSIVHFQADKHRIVAPLVQSHHVN